MPAYTCPHCQKTVTVAERSDLPTRPFCCQRCQQIDLGKWLSGAYVISDPLPQNAIPLIPDDEAAADDAA
jgi:endogenous inhibitor of DNA gyrase (YacG/DUF329 family)